MTRILFVCLGNICRSPMAEFVFKDLAGKRGLGDQFMVASAGTSAEELGNPVHRGTRAKLQEHGISPAGKTAVQLQKADYPHYDLFVAMEARNAQAMRRLFGGDPDEKIHTLLAFTPRGGDIADPWYTGNFDATWQDVLEGCEGLLATLTAQNGIGGKPLG